MGMFIQMLNRSEVIGVANTVFELMSNTVFALRGMKLVPETLK